MNYELTSGYIVRKCPRAREGAGWFLRGCAMHPDRRDRRAAVFAGSEYDPLGGNVCARAAP